MFKNLQVYVLTKPLNIEDVANVINKEEFAFQPCGKSESYRVGWHKQLSNAWCVTHGKNMLMTMRKQEKVIPAAVVNEALKERIAVIEIQESRKVGRKERLTIKEDLMFELMPRAFVKSSYTKGFISGDIIVVDSSSSKGAEEFLDLLRVTIGSLSVVPLNTKFSPSFKMTQWLSSSSTRPVALNLDGQCELRSDLEEGSIIRCKKEDTDADEVLAHIECGMVVTKLALELTDKVSFILCEDFSIKRLRFDDMIIDEVRESYSDDERDTVLTTDFCIYGLEVVSLINYLVKELGGISK